MKSYLESIAKKPLSWESEEGCYGGGNSGDIRSEALEDGEIMFARELLEKFFETQELRWQDVDSARHLVRSDVGKKVRFRGGLQEGTIVDYRPGGGWPFAIEWENKILSVSGDGRFGVEPGTYFDVVEILR